MDLPLAQSIATAMGFPFIPFEEVSNDINTLDLLRDRPSGVAAVVFPQGPKMSEGIVIRPVHQVTDHHGDRMMVKHKQGWASETGVPMQVDPELVGRLELGAKTAEYWVTPMRVEHVAQHIIGEKPSETVDKTLTMRDTKQFLDRMLADVTQEAQEAGTPLPAIDEVAKSIQKRAAQLFKTYVEEQNKVETLNEAAIPRLEGQPTER